MELAIFLGVIILSCIAMLFLVKATLANERKLTLEELKHLLLLEQKYFEENGRFSSNPEVDLLLTLGWVQISKVSKDHKKIVFSIKNDNSELYLENNQVTFIKEGKGFYKHALLKSLTQMQPNNLQVA